MAGTMTSQQDFPTKEDLQQLDSEECHPQQPQPQQPCADQQLGFPSQQAQMVQLHPAQQQVYFQAYPTGYVVTGAPPSYNGESRMQFSHTIPAVQQPVAPNFAVVGQPIIVQGPGQVATVQIKKDYYFTFSIVMVVVAIFSIICLPFVIFPILGLICASSARNAASRGDFVGANKRGHFAVCLNIVPIICVSLGIGSYILYIIIAVSVH